jgi:hypothetical protein
VTIFSRLLVIVALFTCTGLAQEPQKTPTLDRNAFTFLNWNLDLRVEAQTSSLFARGKITLRNDASQAQRQVSLQISSSLKWASIRQNGAAAAFTTSKLHSDVDHSGNVEEAIVSLPAAVAPGASLELEVGYSGTVSLDTTRLAQLGAPLAIRAATDYDRITPTFTCLRGVGHVLWFPASLEPALMSEGNRVFEETSAWAVRHSSSTMTLRAEIDNSNRVLSNAQQVVPGVELSPPNGPSIIVYKWQHLGLAGPVLIAAAYEDAALPEPAKSAFSISFFAQHRTQAGDYARAIANTPALVTGKAAGPVMIVELPEAEDTIFADDTMLLMPFKTIDRKSLELTIAYMLTHQSLWSPRAWIYEGAAHLAQVLMRERQDGRAAAIAYMQQRLAPLTLVDSGAAETAKTNSLVNTTSEVFYRTKAMYVWWMLRELVGQRALLDSLQQYDPEADTEPSYIQKLIEKNSHKDMEWFFDDWVYRDAGLPEFSVSNGYARPSLQGIFLVSATVENKGSASAEVPVIVHTQSGDVTSRVRVPGHTKTALRVEVGSRPTEVTVNDGSVPELDRSDNTTAVKMGKQ